MHKSFYASGFFYHPASQQILLQQQAFGDELKFILFRGKSENGNSPQTVFQQCVKNILGVSITSASIRPVYDYIHSALGTQFIYYVEVAKVIPKKLKANQQTQWLSLAKLNKHNMSEQTRHDIIVGERVINAAKENN